MVRRDAWPGRTSITCVWSGHSLSLLMMKAMPADALRLLGLIEVWMVMRLPKSCLISDRCWGFRWVSWRQRMLSCF